MKSLFPLSIAGRMNRRNFIQYTLTSIVPSSLVSCASSSGFSMFPKYLVTPEMMNGEITKHFPYNHEIYALGSLRAFSPTLSLLPSQNKVRLHSQISLSPSASMSGLINRFIPKHSTTVYDGIITLNSGLRYEGASRGIYLQEPTVHALQLHGVPSAFTRQVQVAVNAFLPDFIEKKPVHTLDHSLAAQTLKSITVREEGVALGFGL